MVRGPCHQQPAALGCQMTAWLCSSPCARRRGDEDGDRAGHGHTAWAVSRAVRGINKGAQMEHWRGMVASWLTEACASQGFLLPTPPAEERLHNIGLDQEGDSQHRCLWASRLLCSTSVSHHLTSGPLGLSPGSVAFPRQSLSWLPVGSSLCFCKGSGGLCVLSWPEGPLREGRMS